ncbi:MAG: hypothetical protein LC777_11075 [Actinobacteria bacterium]|nr:hypothetical protein [Actinomycetota bacterium]
MVVLPYFVVVELLGPVVEAAGLLGLVAAIALAALDWTFADPRRQRPRPGPQRPDDAAEAPLKTPRT